ncbi:MAG: type II secretory pathway predicted ATPase ExeA [Candidatus Azotimanducaceae bacterium]|jgi:type II secretory pathway predicted ATPase ExeA
MYLEHFGLQKPPFRITPDTHVFFEGSDRGATLHALCYAIATGEGITKVVGEVGTGKTMLCRMLPTTLGDDIDWAYLAHPSLSPEQILHEVARELGLAVTEHSDKLTVMRQLQATLLERHASNRKVVVLVEEAQEMPLETLEELRLLSNLETDEYKLLQIVLFGQPELDEKLAGRKIRPLRERITHSLYLSPLQLQDIHAYLNFRIRACGYTGPDLFSIHVAKSIHRYSHGLIRRINILADKALLAAYAKGSHNLNIGDIKKAARDSRYKPRRRWWPWPQALAIGIIGTCLYSIMYPQESVAAESTEISIKQPYTVQGDRATNLETRLTTATIIPTTTTIKRTKPRYEQPLELKSRTDHWNY